MRKDALLVEDSRASGEAAVVISLEKRVHAVTLKLPGGTVKPGRYRLTLQLRSPRLNTTEFMGTDVRLSVRAGAKALASRPCGAFSFSTASEYEDIALTFLITKPCRPTVVLGWVRSVEASAMAQAEKAPAAPGMPGLQDTGARPGEDAGLIPLKLKELTFPCLLADRVLLGAWEAT